MIIIENIQEMQALAKKNKIMQKTIGFVPTMGSLHEGHLSLVKEAKKNNDLIVMSIFVNPTQFGPNEDFESYPRNFEQDKELAKEHGVDILFYPSTSEMYPSELTTEIHVMKRTNVLCGSSRPGHFDGVATVLFKLFHIVLPDDVYFGMKDAQQIAVIDGFLNDYNFPINLISCPTIREADGLAKSSRNVNLTSKERQEAPRLYHCIKRATELTDKGERHTEKIRNLIYDKLSSSISGKIDYLEILTYPNLTPVNTLSGKVIIAVAVRYSNVRLIDNIIWSIKEV